MPKRKNSETVTTVTKKRKTTHKPFKGPLVRLRYGPGNPRSPMPVSGRGTLRYIQTGLNLDPQSTIPGRYFFRANDMFDPDYTSTGHQPLGFDQWMSLYNKFTVTSSKIKVVFNNTTDYVSADFLVYLRKTTTPSENTLQDTLESAGCQWRIMSKYNSPVMRESYVSSRHHPTLSVEDINMFGTASASPADQWYYELGVAGDANQDVGECKFHVEIEYSAIFFDRKVLTGS